jgi:hypothetical protein
MEGAAVRIREGGAEGAGPDERDWSAEIFRMREFTSSPSLGSGISGAIREMGGEAGGIGGAGPSETDEETGPAGLGLASGKSAINSPKKPNRLFK